MDTHVGDFVRAGGSDFLPLLARLSPEWVVEVFEARRTIGALIAQQAALHASTAHVRELRECLAAVATAEGSNAVQLADAEVHLALARATGNRVYILLTKTLFNVYLPMRDGLNGPFKDSRAAYNRLNPIITAVSTGDKRAARVAAEEYLIATERVMLEGLRTAS
jgi:DNA-binding FadR family transcriptional regulator